MINDFTDKFVNIELDFIQLGDSFYRLSDDLNLIYLKIKNQNDFSISEPEYLGEYLGKIKKNKFIPSFSLIELIYEKTDKIAKINNQASWLFLCGRDVFKKSIIKCEYKGDVIVINENNEILGLGNFDGRNINNILDRGDFLRREK